jgi:ribosomal protein S18 acetylase RimI-like enzyme
MGESTVRVRAARRGDLQPLADLRMRHLGELAHGEPRLRLLPDARQRTEQSLPVWMGQEDRILLVAEHSAPGEEGEAADATLVGYAMGVLVLSPPILRNQHLGEIKECFVAPERRGEGTGGELVAVLTRVLVGRGADVLRAEVPVTNAAASGQLEAAGYRPLQLVMERRMNAP